MGSAADVLRDLKALRTTLAADTKKYQAIGSARDKLAKEVAAAQKENSKLKNQISHLKRACTQDAPAAKWFPADAAAPVGDGEGRWAIAVKEVNGRFKLSVAAPNYCTFYGTRSGSGAGRIAAAPPVSTFSHRFYVAVGMAVEAQRTSGGAWESATVSGLPKDDLGSWELTGDGDDKWKEMIHYSAIRARRKFAPPSAPAPAPAAAAARGARADAPVPGAVNAKTPPAIAKEIKQMNTTCDSLEARIDMLERKGKGNGGSVAGTKQANAPRPGTDWREALPAAQGVSRCVSHKR
jgi:hypothetical protein